MSTYYETGHSKNVANLEDVISYCVGYGPARDFIFEEKNTFLTRGKRKNKMGIRGADGRMGYITDAETILKIVMDWVISNDSDVNLFTTLRELNKSMGYGTRQF